MKKCDLHIHGEYSGDSVIEFDPLVQKAIAHGYFQIAFTEHFDYLPCVAVEYGLPPYHDYVKTVRNLQEKYRGQIEILLGAEIGETHRVGEYMNAIIQHEKPELIIGSVHVLSNGVDVSIPLIEELTPKEIIDYYEQNLAMVENGSIDTLGHLGIHKRYLDYVPDESFAQTVIDRILETLIKTDTALEVNYSPLRKPYGRFLAEEETVRRFLELGGKLVAIGSDSHELSNFDDNYERTVSLLAQSGCRELAFRKNGSWSTFPIEGVV